jgi:hypothetical protein
MAAEDHSTKSVSVANFLSKYTIVRVHLLVQICSRTKWDRARQFAIISQFAVASGETKMMAN